MELIPLITDAGIQAAFNASSTGLSADITHIALGSASYAPQANQIGLTNEQMRVPIADGKMLDTKQLHVTALASGASQFWIREVGFILADGTLLAVWSEPNTALAFKADGVNLLLAFDLALTALPASSITIQSTGASLNLNFAEELSIMATAQIGTMRRQVSNELALLAQEDALAQRLRALDNHITRLDNRRDYLKQQLDAQANRLERIQPNYRLSKNQRLLGAATPDFWSLHPDMTLTKVLTVADNVLWANRSAEEQALLTAMGKPDTRYIHQPFDVWRMSWTAMPTVPYTMYQRVNQTIETTVAAMVKLEAGAISGSWASGAKLNTWVNTGENQGPSGWGYTNIHPMRASTAGSLLVALPAAVAGYVPLGEGRWGDFPYIGDTQND